MKFMTNRKLIFILLVFSLILCVGSVSASEDSALVDSADTVALDDSDFAILEDSGAAPISAQEDEITTADEVQEIESSSDYAEELSTDASGKDSLSYYSPDYDDYDALVYDTAFTYGSSDNNLIVYVDAEAYSDYYYSYNFYVRIYDSSDNLVYESQEYDYKNFTGTITYTFDSEEFNIGTYYIDIVNYDDDMIMSSATLNVNAIGVLSANNYVALYNSGSTFNVKLTEKNTGSAISNSLIIVVFKKGSKTYKRTAYTDSNGVAKITPNIPVGTYSVQVSVSSSRITASSLTKTATVKKTGIKMKTYKINTYQGIKFNLKAVVKSSSGKNVNEGYVLFKINGRKYKVKVKNGVASKKMKIAKVTKGKYTAKYLANSNYKASKKQTKKYNIKKRYATKVKVKNYSGYGGSSKTITATVRTKSGKKVKSGYVLFTSSGGYYNYAPVRNGKAKVSYSFYNYYYYSFYTYYYSKNTKFTLKAKYYPTTYKYKCSSKSFKVTHKYKCGYCGKKKTHKHGFYEMNVS